HVDREVLADVAHEFDRTEPGQPLGVVHHARRRLRVVEIEKSRELPANALDVLFHLFHREQLPLDGLPTRIADHAGSTADDGDRAMSAALHVREREDDQQVSYVKTLRGRIEPDVTGDLFLRERLSNAFG